MAHLPVDLVPRLCLHPARRQSGQKIPLDPEYSGRLGADRLLLLAEKLFLGRLLERLLERLPKAVRWLYTAFFVLIGWVLFDLTDFPSLCHALKLMFVPQATDWVAAAATNVSLLKAVVYLPLGIVCCLPLLRREPKSAKGILLANLASGLLLIVCIVFILSSSYNPFIYFRF